MRKNTSNEIEFSETKAIFVSGKTSSIVPTQNLNEILLPSGPKELRTLTHFKWARGSNDRIIGFAKKMIHRQNDLD